MALTSHENSCIKWNNVARKRTILVASEPTGNIICGRQGIRDGYRWLAKGDTERAAGRYDEAINHYGHAWHEALHA